MNVRFGVHTGLQHTSIGELRQWWPRIADFEHLKELKIGPALVIQGNDFSIQDRGPHRQFSHRFPDLRKTPGEILPIARVQLDIFAILDGQCAVAIEL